MIKNKKNFFLIILIFILFIFSTSIYAYSSLTNFAPKYGKTISRVNFRSVSSTSSSIIKVLAKGTSVKMVGIIDDFYIVQLGTNEVGTVSKKYVSSFSSAPKGASTYTMISKKIAYTNGSNINLRRGPGTNFKSITKLSNGTNITVIGYISDWYLCITKTGYIGMIKKNLLTFNKVFETPKTTTPTETINTKGDTNEELVLKLINEARTKAGLKALKMDASILKIARLKSNDMVNKEYFSHTSPTYGSPFAMMKNYGVSYKVAGENIAGNPNLSAAVESWINSNTHKQNILSGSYNLVGIGVTKSSVYGYIIVAMFVGR